MKSVYVSMLVVPLLVVPMQVVPVIGDDSVSMKIRRDDDAGELTVVMEGHEILTYQYGKELAIPHLWPIRSPAGKLLTVQHPNPYPHHRSLWIADKLQCDGGPIVDFYHCIKNYNQQDKPESGFRHFIRHQRFGELKAESGRVVIEAELTWFVNETTPVLDDSRTMSVTALGNGEYLLDLAWELKASHGDVKILSDDVHYAWPYVRMHPQFSGESGGVLVNDRGQQGQSGTHDQVAKWIDYSNTVEGTTEGLAVFIFDEGQEHRWLTREYGTFGPRRPDKYSGSRFDLRVGDSLRGRVGILVHRGDVTSGKVAVRYREYLEGKH